MNSKYTFIIFCLFFTEEGNEGEREGEKHPCARETMGCLLHAPKLETWPAAQAPAVTGN